MLEKSDKKIALLDANNFYVSCERLFNPKIKDKATVVLSNNDGCVIARSQEVKDMGIKMGHPLFKLDEDIKNSMEKFSSNYVLYGDISDRIANLLKKFSTKLEVYSIDESFMDLSHIPDDKLIDFCKMIKSEIWRLTGIPISIGVGPNKTLAKLMNGLAKKNKELEGVNSYWHSDPIHTVQIGEVWGIGSKWESKLKTLGVHTIEDFLNLPDWQVKKIFTVVGLRTWLELKEYLIHPIKIDFKKPKVVTSSRSFGRTIWQKSQVKNAIWTFLEDACNKLRLDSLKPCTIIIFTATNRFEPDYHSWHKKIKLSIPSNDRQIIWNQILKYLEEIPLSLWAKAGIICYDLIEDTVLLPRIFEEEIVEAEAPIVEEQAWMTRRDFLSPLFTTDWNQIPKID